MSQQSAAAPPSPAPRGATGSAPGTAGTAPGAGTAGAGRPAMVPAPGARPVAAPAIGGSRTRTWVRGQLRGTPGRMRLLGALAALATALFGVLGAASLRSSATALDQSAANTAQLVRVQSIYADVLRADADATNAFLVGGLEDPAQRADYTDTMRRLTATITEAAREQRADGTALAALAQQVGDYSAQVEQARAYNRQGLPVGAQYLTSASSTLRAQALPIIESLRQANLARAQQEFTAASSAPILVAVGIVALLVLTLVGTWLARRTHRYLNPGLTGAAATVLAALVTGLVLLGSISGDVNRVREGQFAGTLALTNARSAAYDAKALESLSLIQRGQGRALEAPWNARAATVSAELDKLTKVPGDTAGAGLATAWAAYTAAYGEVRALDNGGNWDGAVAKATTGDPGGSRPAFAAFTLAGDTALKTYQDSLQTQVGAPATKANVAALLVLLAGLGAAVAATRGIAKRVEEYR